MWNSYLGCALDFIRKRNCPIGPSIIAYVPFFFRRDLFDEDIFARPEEEQPETDDRLEKLDGIDPAAQGNLLKGVDNKTVTI